MKNNSKTVMTMIIIGVLFLILFGMYVAVEMVDSTNNQKEVPKQQEQKKDPNETVDNFKRAVNGYVTKVKIANDEVVYFNVVNPDSLVKEFIDGSQGNTFFNETGFAIGCLDNNQIIRENTSDANGNRKYIISEFDTEKLLNSSIDNPVSIVIEVKENSEPSGTDSLCYSFITNINVNK